MGDTGLLYNYLLVGTLLFSIGLVGFTVRRNLIVVFLSAEIMLQGVSVTLIGWSRYHQDFGGQMLVLFIIAVAACEAALALALILMLVHRTDSLDLTIWQRLREPQTAPYVDRRIPEPRVEEQTWPTLTPAGREPVVDEDEFLHRSRI